MLCPEIKRIDDAKFDSATNISSLYPVCMEKKCNFYHARFKTKPGLCFVLTGRNDQEKTRLEKFLDNLWSKLDGKKRRSHE